MPTSDATLTALVSRNQHPVPIEGSRVYVVHAHTRTINDGVTYFVSAPTMREAARVARDYAFRLEYLNIVVDTVQRVEA